MGRARSRWSLALALALACACNHGLYTDDGTSEGDASSTGPGTTGTNAGSVSASTTTATPTATASSSSTGGGVGVTSSSGAGSSTTSCEFICDDEDAPSDGLCDTFAQDCPGEDTKCVAYDSDDDGYWDATRCVPVTGDDQLYEPCTAEPGKTGIESCAKGLFCWSLDEDGNGVCYAQCMGTPENPVCLEATSCVLCGGCVVTLCHPTCDPLLDDCAVGESCIGDTNSDGFICLQNASDGMAPEGAPCEFANACNPGLMCVNPDFYPGPDCQGSIGCCAPFCDLGNGDADCEGLSVANAACVSYYEPWPAPEGLEHIGVCGVPG